MRRNVIGSVFIVAVLATGCVGVSPEEAALRRVIAESGADCLQGADISWSPDQLEAAATSRGITEGWIDDGFSWVGSARGLINARGGVALPGSTDEVWVQLGTGQAAQAVQYRRVPSTSITI